MWFKDEGRVESEEKAERKPEENYSVKQEVEFVQPSLRCSALNGWVYITYSGSSSTCTILYRVNHIG